MDNHHVFANRVAANSAIHATRHNEAHNVHARAGVGVHWILTRAGIGIAEVPVPGKYAAAAYGALISESDRVATNRVTEIGV